MRVQASERECGEEEEQEDPGVQRFSKLMLETHFSIFSPKDSLVLLRSGCHFKKVIDITSVPPQMVLN